MRYFFMVLGLLLLLVACKGKKEAAPADPDIYYTCSMDPQVKKTNPASARSAKWI